MTEPDLEQWVLLECDWQNADDCLVRSDSVRYKDVGELGWSQPEPASEPDEWVCPNCWDAYLTADFDPNYVIVE